MTSQKQEASLLLSNNPMCVCLCTVGTPSTDELQQVINKLLDAAAAGSKGGAAAADADASDSKDKEAEDKPQKKEEDADNSLLLYLKLRAELAAQFPDPAQIVVDFSGVESGRVEALVRARRAADPAFVSGLESSAVDGEGLNIDSFKPQRSSVQLSPGMLLPAEAAERLAAVRAARQAERVLAPPQGWTQRYARGLSFGGLGASWLVLESSVLTLRLCGCGAWWLKLCQTPPVRSTALSHRCVLIMMCLCLCVCLCLCHVSVCALLQDVIPPVGAV